MPYKFAAERENYELYASGSVLYALPGRPAFPVRLANEIFHRCLAYRAAAGEPTPCRLYDPCCGGAYHLTTLAYLNWPAIKNISASDIDPDALALAGRNLSLLTLAGLERRISELRALADQHGKPSHHLSHQHALALKQRLQALAAHHLIETDLFLADATSNDLLAGFGPAKAELVITDIPYGQHAHWQTTTPTISPPADPTHQMLEALLPVLAPAAIVAVAAPKGEAIRHESYLQLKKLKHGKRQVVFLKPRVA